MVYIFTWLCVNLKFPISLIALSWNQFYFRKNYNLFQLSLIIEKLKLQHQWTRKEKIKGKEMYRLNKGIKEQNDLLNMW